MSKIVPHPYHYPPYVPAWSRLYHPSVAGALTATLATFAPRPSIFDPLASTWDRLVDVGGIPGHILSAVPRRLCLILIGYACGYVTFRCFDWTRWRAIKTLLRYTGWVSCPSSVKTKVWGVTLRILMGAAPVPTLQLQSVLPKQPLPDLDTTLDRWLRASRQFVTKEEFEDTMMAVETFRTNEGPQLQKYLKKKAKKTVSWLADYWLTAAYLASRNPIAINNNYNITTGFPLGKIKPDMLTRTATWVFNFATFDKLISEQIVPPLTINGAVPLCMNGFSFIFGTLRQPGEHMDTIVKYTDKHIIVIRSGQYFKLSLIAKERNSRRYSVLTAQEIRLQLQQICEQAERYAEVPSVAALTSQNRTLWAKQRAKLMEKNQEALQDVESAMFILCLDKQQPKDVHDFCRIVLAGNGNGKDRWYDKCFTMVAFEGGMLGANVEHSMIDATVFGNLCEYAALNEKYADGKIINDPCNPPRTLDFPTHITWNLEDMQAEIEEAIMHCRSTAEDLDMYLFETRYGKGLMKKKRISPDGYIQMMFQLAYYQMNKTVAKTYEPSTGRLFHLGRTETVHPGSPHSVAWLHSMDDPTSTKQTRQELFRKAVKYQSQIRLEATIGQGCDRHLLGLLCASRELGMDLPQIFMDKAWCMPFILSTSQTPTRSFEYGTAVQFDSASGGFGPGCKEGYGICYILLGEDRINMAITSWKSAGHGGSKRFAMAVEKAMEDTKLMLS